MTLDTQNQKLLDAFADLLAAKQRLTDLGGAQLLEEVTAKTPTKKPAPTSPLFGERLVKTSPEPPVEALPSSTKAVESVMISGERAQVLEQMRTFREGWRVTNVMSSGSSRHIISVFLESVS